MQIIAQILTTLLCFGLFFVVMKKFFWGGVIGAIEERQTRIKGEFDRIDALQAEVAALKADYERRLAEIEAESRTKITEAINEGKRIAEQIAESARVTAAEEAEKTRSAVQHDVERLRIELRQTVVKLTLAATEKLIREKVSDKKQREMVDHFVEELAKR